MGVIVLPLVSASIPTNRLRSRLLVSTAVPALVASFGAVAHAGGLPTGGIPTAGTTIATPTSTQMQITSTTTRSAISWQDFSIGAGNSVNVAQPNASSTQLESVRGTNVSQIFGSLTSNGSIVIANPNGIWFGPNAQVDVAGLAAVAASPSAADVTNFMHGGRLNVSQAGNANAAVINQGTITISNAGLAAFVAPGVRNDGIIQAKLGTVQLSSGTTATLDFYGDGLISIAVSGQTLAQAIDPSTGKPMSAAAGNTGTINADGGTVLITANTAANVVNDAINVSGVVQARSVSEQNGQIVLDGGSNGNVQVAGSLDASGTGSGQTGGSVKVLGNQVALGAGAKIDVSGDAGGGTADIGGDFHGAGPDRNAQATYVDANATINADAITSGNGGQVAVWSDQATTFNGTISARGGSQSGNGGYVETSGRSLAVGHGARVNTTALRGATGTWLLDPENVTISGSTGDDTAALSGGTITFTPEGAGSATIRASDITADLNTNNVVITTTTTPNPDPGQAGDIEVNAAINWGSGSGTTLTLNAAHNIDVNAGISSTNGSLAMTAANMVTISAPISMSGSVGVHGPVTFNDGTANPLVSTGTGQHYFNAATLAANATLTDSTGQLIFSGTVNGPFTLNASGVTFGSSVGVNQLIASDVTLDSNVTTAGGQTYNGLTLQNNVTLTDTVSGAISFGTVTGSSNSLTIVDDAAPTFTGGVSGLTSVTLAPNTATATIGVGDSSLQSLVGTVKYDFVSGGGLASLATSSGTIGIGTASDSGTITLTQLGGASHTTLKNLALTNGSGGAITVSGAYDGTGALTVQAGTGGIALSANVTTGGTQTYAGAGAVTLDANTTLSNSGGGITFDNPVGGSFVLDVVSGAVTFDGTVNVGQLITQAATLDNNVTTAGGQAYSGAVTLGNSVTLTDSTGAAIDFLSTLAGGNNNLTVVDNTAPAFSNTVSNIGTATLAPFTATDTIGVGDSSKQALVGTVKYDFISTGGLFKLEDGASTIAIGTGSDSGTITATSLTLTPGLVLTNGSTGGIAFTGAVGAGSLTAQSGSGNIALDGGTIVTTGGQTYSGSITLGGDTLLEATASTATVTFGVAENYNSANNLAVLVGGGLTVNNSIQNSGSGALTLVAGWDGTAPTSAANVANLISGTHYGSTGGNVVIGNGSQGSTVAVGSALGNTTVLGDNVTLRGSSVTNNYLTGPATGAQIGFNVVASAPNTSQFMNATGNITVGALGTVLLQSGPNDSGFAQIGHGGAGGVADDSSTSLSATGAITVNAAAVTLAASSGGYAQIGHGGASFASGDNELYLGSSLNFGGTITVEASGTIALQSSNSGGYAQIGHGGEQAFYSTPFPTGFVTSGSITVGAASLALSAGTFGVGYAQIGHGEDPLSVTYGASFANSNTGGVSGNIDITVTSTFSTSGQNILIGSRAAGTVTTPLFIEARDFGGGFGPSSVEDTAGGQVVVAVTDPAGYSTGGFTASGGHTFALLATGELSVTGTIGSDGTIDLIGGWNGASGVPSAGGTFDLSPGTGALKAGAFGNGSAGSNGISLGANVSTSGSGGVTLAGPVTLTSTVDLTGATVTVLSALDAATNGGESLTVTGNAVFDGAVGSTHELGTLDVTGGTTLAGGSVTTTAVQTYGGAVTLDTDTTLTATNGSGASNNTITFDSTVDGAHALTVDSTWPAVFDGAVGGTTPLTSLSVPTFVSFGASVGSVKTSGPMSLGVTGNSVTAAGNLTLDSSAGSGAISLGQFGGLGNTLAVSSGSGAVTFDGVMVPKLVVTSTGTETLNSGTYHVTSGTNTYENSNGAVTLEGNLVFSSSPFAFGAVTLAADTDISTFSGAPNVTFLSTVDATTAGAQGLTISTSSGSGLTATTTFGGVVGGIHALKTLSLTDSAGTTTISGGSVTTSGSGGQSFAGAVVLTGATTLDSSAGNGPIAFAGNISGASDTLAIKSGSGNVTFGGVTVGALSVTTTGSETLNAGTYDIGTGTAAITWGTNGTVTLDGALVFDQPATFDTATLTGNTTVDTSAGNGAVDFTGNISGAGETLAITSGSGNVTFNGLTVAALSVTTTGTETVDAGTYAIGNGSTPYTWGTVALDGIYVFGQDTTFGVVTLDANTTISTTSGTNAITFGSTVDAASPGAESLTVDTSGATTFSGNVGHGAPLASLTVTGPVTLGANVTLSGTGGVDLAGTVDSSGTGVTTDGHGLTVSGNATFGGAIGGNFALGSLLVTGTTALNGGTVDTTGGQTYSGAITLGGNTTLDSAAGNGAIHFGGAVNGASDTLTINTGTGGVVFSGFDFNVAGLAIDGPETLDTGTYTLTGGTLSNSAGIGLEGTLDFAQNTTFASAVTLDANTSILTTTGSAAITFGSTVTGAHALTVNTTGATTLDGNVTTAGGQTYSGPVTLGGNITLTDTSGGTIDFGSTLAGAFSIDLTILDNTAPVFGGAVSEILVATLAPDTTSATIGVGDSSLEALVGTAKYDFVSTGGLANLVTGAGAIDIGTTNDTGTLTVTQLGGSASTTPGYFALVNGGAIAISGAYVGNAALTVQSGSGGITLGANVTTAFNQVYSGNVTVGANVTLSATTSSGANTHGVDFTGTVDGASAGADSLTVDLGNNGINATFDGNVGGNFALASLTANTGTGRAVFNNGISVTTSGSGGQSYSDGATLNGDTTFAAGGSNPIVFGYIVTGAHSLTVTSGATTFSGNVSVGALNVQAVDIAAGSSNFGTVTTTGGQTYSGAISLGTNALLEATGTSATITFDGASAYTSGSSLGVLATGNIDVNAAIQNSGTGAISLVAGWDGATQPTSASNVANIISGTNTFGKNSGSVLVGTGTQTGRDAVGSAGGATVVLGDNVILTGGSAGGTDTDAQIGFRGANATGAITVDALGAVELLGGSDTHAYAQIGHGGALVDLTGSATSGALSGSIDVTAGSVTLAGGTGNVAYAQIGHGGAFGFSGNSTIGTITVSGGIAVDATGNIDIAGGDTAASNGTSYGQIGHGGFGFAVSTTLSGGDAVSGDIVVSGANIGLTGGAGSGARNYAQIGMRTGDASTISNSNIDVRSTTGTLTVSSDTSGGFLIGEAVPTGSTTTGDNVFIEAAHVVEQGGTADDLASGSNLLTNLGGDTGAGSVAFAITSTGGLTVAGATYGGSGALAFLTEGPLVVGSGGIANTGAGSIGLVSGWDGSTGVPGTPGASAFNVSTVLSTGTAYGSHGITLGGNVTTGLTTGNAVALAGPVTLDANLIVGSAGGTSEFLGTVDSSDIATAGTSDGHSLTVSGNASFGGAVGGTFRLGGLEVTGTTVLPSSVATSAGQDYLGSVTLGAGTVTLSDSGTAGITFGSSVNGSGDALDVTEGATTFDSAVTVGSLDLQAVAFNFGSAHAVATSAGQTYNGAVTVTGPVQFSDSNSSAITFDGTVDGATAGVGNVSVNTNGTVTFSEAVGHGEPLASLNIDSATIDLSGGSVTTSSSGGQTYQGPVTLGADTTLVATGTNATVAFNSNLSTVSGNHALTIAAVGGTEFGAAIDVSSLSVTNTTGEILILTSNITTTGTGGQFYAGPVVLFTSPTLDAGSGNPVAFENTVDSNTSTHDGLTITGNVTFGATVGGSTALGSLGVTGTTDLSGGSVVTTGGQTYGGPVVLGATTTLTASAVDFQSTVDSSDTATAGTTDGNSLTVSGAATFGETVGGTYALGSLDVTGAAAVNGGGVFTTGNQTYGGAVSLHNTGGTTFGASSLFNAGAIDFTSTIDGVSSASLTIAIGANSVTFAGSVGATGPLSAITDKATNTVIGGATMATSGPQQYLSDNTTLTNTSGTTFSASSGSGYIQFSTLDGATAGTVPLTVSLSGFVVDFSGPVGANAALESIVVTGGKTLFDTTAINTTGTQEYGAVSVRETNVTLTGSTVTFDGAVDSFGGLTTNGDGLTVSGDASFGDTVGGTYALGSLDVTGGTTINTATITTTGGQTYGGAVSLTVSNATLTSTNGGAIGLLGAVDGLGSLGSALLISTGGSVSLGGTIGGFQPLASLTVDPGPGDLTISSTAIITTGAQLYEHPVVLAASTTLTGTSVTFDDAVDSSDTATAGISDGHGLTVSGAATFGGPVGGAYALGSLDVTGSTEFNPGSAALDVVTTGAQEYDGGISVDSGSGSVVLEVTNATGTITLGGNSSYDSGADLSLLSEGGIAFDHSLRNFGSGAINVVAGWDGSTGLSSGAFSFGTLSSAISSGSYTQGAGDVSIGDGTQTSGIDVGSRDGATNVAADNVTLKGSTGTPGGYAQLGYNADDAAFSADGNITVLASGAVELLGGANQAYAQIGHGGYLAGEFSCGGSFTIASNIDVLALSVTLAGGSGSDAYAQIGHGGDQAFAGNRLLGGLTVSGSIGVTATGGDVSLSGGTGGDAYAQIGHGGDQALANANVTGSTTLGGSIDVSAGGNIVVAGGTSTTTTDNYAQIGHGGLDFSANTGVSAMTLGDVAATGDITVTSTSGTVSLGGGKDQSDYVQIGHGGLGFAGNVSTVSTASLSMGAATLTGNITVGAAGDITLTGGSGGGSADAFDAYAQIGHGGDAALSEGPASGTTTIGGTTTLGGAISVVSSSGSVSLGGNDDYAYAQIGHGGLTIAAFSTLADVSVTGGVTVDGATGVNVTGGAGSTAPGNTNTGAYAQVGNGGEAFLSGAGAGVVTLDGAITVDGGSGDIDVKGGSGTGSDSYAQIGLGGDSAFIGANLGSLTVGGTAGTIGISTGGAVSLGGGSGSSDYAQIGDGGVNFANSATISGAASLGGAISVSSTSANGGITLSSGAGSGAYSQIGDGGAFAFIQATLSGTSGSLTVGGATDSIDVTAAGDITLQGGSNNSGNPLNAYAQIGDGGVAFAQTLYASAGAAAISGDITVTSTGGAISLSSGNSSGLVGANFGSYAQIGHGGEQAFDAATFDGLTVGGIITVTAEGIPSTANPSAGDVTLSGVSDYVQIGDGGEVFAAFATISGAASLGGAISVTSTSGGVSLGGGSANDAYAQIGHGGDQAFAGDTHLASVTVGSAADTITVSAGGNVTMSGGSSTGSADFAYAQIGDGGGQFASGAITSGAANLEGVISVGSTGGGSVFVDGANNGGSNSDGYAQIGHGGDQAFANATIGTTSGGLTVDGAITVSGLGACGCGVELEGGDPNSYVQIGHGGFEFADGATIGGAALLGGTISVTSTSGGVSLGGGFDNAYAQIGHGGASAFQDATVSAGGLSIGSGNSITVSAGGSDGVEVGNFSIRSTSVSYSGGYGQIGDGGFELAEGANITGGASLGGTIGVSASVGGVGVFGEIDTTPGSDNYAQIGHGGDQAFASATLSGTGGNLTVDGAITVSGAGSCGCSIELDGGDPNSYAQIGHGGFEFAQSATIGGAASLDGAISVTNSGGDVTLGIGDGANFAYAQIGHGGANAFSGAITGGDATLSGDITVSGRFIFISGGQSFGSYAQIGHGGDSAFASADIGGTLTESGDISVFDVSRASVNVDGGSAFGAYAQIGDGGFGFGADGIFAAVDVTAPITVTASHGLEIVGGTDADTYAQIGDGGALAFVNADIAGAFDVSDAVDITVAGFTEHSGFRPGNVFVAGGTGTDAYAQIGDGGLGFATGASESPIYSGTIGIQATGAIFVDAGSTTDEYAVIGNGDPMTNGVLGGTVDVVSGLNQTYIDANNLVLAAGTYGTSNGTISFSDGSGGFATVILSGSITIDNSTTEWGQVTVGNGVTAPNMIFNLSGQDTTFNDNVGSATQPIGTMSISGGDNFTIAGVPPATVFVDTFVDQHMTGIVNFGSTLDVFGKAFLGDPFIGDLVCASGGTSCIVGIGGFTFTTASSFDFQDQTLHLFDIVYALSNPGFNFLPNGANPQAGCTAEEKQANGGSCPANGGDATGFGNAFLGGSKP